MAAERVDLGVTRCGLEASSEHSAGVDEERAAPRLPRPLPWIGLDADDGRVFKGRSSLRQRGHNAHFLNHGATHSAQKVWPHGSLSGDRSATRQMAHSRASASAPPAHCEARTSSSRWVKPTETFFPAGPSETMRPSSAEARLGGNR